jgi:hypothetical protein
MGDYNYSLPLFVIFMLQILLASCNGSESFASTNDTKGAGGTLRLLHVVRNTCTASNVDIYLVDKHTQ